MDNSNSSDSSNNQNSASPFGASLQPAPPPTPPAEPILPPSPPPLTPDWAPPSPQQTPPPPAQPDTWPAPPPPDPTTLPPSSPTPSSPWPSFDSTQTPATPQPGTDETASSLHSSWNPPAQSMPAPPIPIQSETAPDTWSIPSQPDLAPTSQPEVPQIETQPTPTFTPPPVPTEPSQQPDQPLSPLDNPMAAPTNPPPIDGPQPAQPSWMNIPSNPTSDQTQATGTPAHPDSAPTDLSHLISNSPQPGPAQPTSETLVVPSAATQNPEVPAMPAEGHKGIPKWLIGLGAGLLILVVGASAYFILGIGQPPKATTSIPATTTPKETEIKPPLPVATPVAQPATPLPSGSGSANFGELGGNSTGGTQATSAADLIRQRQSQER